jgi:hypothetical protein
MEPTLKPEEAQRVACEVCLKEIPQSEAFNAEAEEYAVHFCGLECYRAWVADAARPQTPGRAKT